MATQLVFPSEEALRLALTGELVPVQVQAGPALVRREEERGLALGE